jgi:hypothetical protein
MKESTKKLKSENKSTDSKRKNPQQSEKEASTDLFHPPQKEPMFLMSQTIQL